MSFDVVKAVDIKSLLRCAIQGPAGSGKTYSALVLAQALGGEVVVIDTERGSSAKFATEWSGFAFDVLDLQPPYDPERYVEAIKFCERDYGVIIIDSLSHAWSGTGGALDIVDKKTAAAGGNKYYAWRYVTPKHNALVDAMLNSSANIIGCMRTKVKYVEGTEGGKKTYKKEGMEAIQREGLDYEFDIVFELTLDHAAIITKSRYAKLADKIFTPIVNETGLEIKEWLDRGIARPERPKTVEDLKYYISTKKLDENEVLVSMKLALDMEKFSPTRWDEMVEFVDNFEEKEDED
jgi:hypothetical protein